MELRAGKEIHKVVTHMTRNLRSWDLSYYLLTKLYYTIAGDFFDIVQTNNRIYMGIGDVVGHGVRSSITMLMVQSVFRSAIWNNPFIDIKDLLNVINYIIYNSNEQSGLDVTMGLSLLMYENKKIIATGSHQPIILYKRDKEPNIFPTIELGMNLGISHSIFSKLNITSFDFDIGDKLLLATDGIIGLKDKESVPYTIDGLAANFVYSCDNYESKDVLSEMLRYMKEWSESNIKDDITLFMLERELKF